MNEPFYLPVIYQGRELELKARFERWGYTYRISVLVAEETFIFEPDEEGGYRALGNAQQLSATDAGLLRAIAEKLTALGEIS